MPPVLIPTHLIKLNPSIVSIPPPIKVDEETPTPTIKLQVCPYLLLPTPVVSPRIRGKKDLDGLFDVIVPVGGAVDVGLTIDEQCVERLSGASEGVEEAIRERVYRAFARNKMVLALESVNYPQSSNHQVTQDDPAQQYLLNSPLLRLRPLSASASEASKIDRLINPGMPIAYLSRLDILIYSGSSAAPSGTSLTLSNSQSSGDNESPAGSRSRDVGEDEAETQGWFGDDEGDEAPAVMILEENVASWRIYGGVASKLPSWVVTQLEEGLARLFRHELIRRFPLIFDSALQNYIPIMTIPRSLTTSLIQFLNISSKHDTPFLSSARPLLTAIQREQDLYLDMRLENILNAGCKGTRVKRRRVNNDTGQTDQAAATPVASQELGEATKEERKQDYLALVKAKIEDWDSTQTSDGYHRGGPDGQLRRCISHAVSRIGKAHWELHRKGMGRMAARKIKLISVEEEAGSSILAMPNGASEGHGTGNQHLLRAVEAKLSNLQLGDDENDSRESAGALDLGALSDWFDDGEGEDQQEGSLDDFFENGNQELDDDEFWGIGEPHEELSEDDEGDIFGWDHNTDDDLFGDGELDTGLRNSPSTDQRTPNAPLADQVRQGILGVDLEMDDINDAMFYDDGPGGRLPAPSDHGAGRPLPSTSTLTDGDTNSDSGVWAVVPNADVRLNEPEDLGPGPGMSFDADAYHSWEDNDLDFEGRAGTCESGPDAQAIGNEEATEGSDLDVIFADSEEDELGWYGPDEIYPTQNPGWTAGTARLGTIREEEDDEEEDGDLFGHCPIEGILPDTPQEEVEPSRTTYSHEGDDQYERRQNAWVSSLPGIIRPKHLCEEGEDDIFGDALHAAHGSTSGQENYRHSSHLLVDSGRPGAISRQSNEYQHASHGHHDHPDDDDDDDLWLEDEPAPVDQGDFNFHIDSPHPYHRGHASTAGHYTLPRGEDDVGAGVSDEDEIF